MRSLGEFEQLLLFALLRLTERQAHGASIAQEIRTQTGRAVAPGAIYTALDRMEARGLVSSRLGDATPARGGRRKKLYRLEPAGARALADSYTRLRRMAEGMQSRLNDLQRANL